jgi:hypothetical protein
MRLKSSILTRWLRLPSLLLVLITTLVLVTTLPAGTDITADRVLGQAVFTLDAADFVDAAGFNFSNGSIGEVTEADGVAVDTSSTPQHLYVADSLNSRILGWNNSESFANGQPADLVIGQPDMFHYYCNPTGGPSASDLCLPTAVAVDSSGDLYIADYTNNRVLEYSAPYAAYAGLGDTCTAANPCENELSASRVFGQFSGGVPSFTTSACAASNTGMCNPEGVSVNLTTGDLYVADTTNSRVLMYLNPLAGGGGDNGTSGFAGDETADYVFGQTSFTANKCNQGLSAPTASTLCGSGFFVGGGGVGVGSNGDVYIADTLNNRVLQFNQPITDGVTPVTTAFSADGVFGQANFAGQYPNQGTGQYSPGPTTASTLSEPIDVKLDTSGNLYIADFENGRVLEFNSPAASSIDPAANSVIGQQNFGSSCFTTSATCVVNASGVAIGTSLDGETVVPGDVFVADLYNNRVLQYDSPLSAEGNTAAAVLGQAVFDLGLPNLVDGKSLSLPHNVTIDPYSTPNHIYVSDGANQYLDLAVQNRVLAWYDAQSFTNGQPADLVFGQPDFYHIAGNNGVNGLGNPGPDTLSVPQGMTVDSSSNLYIVDSGNNRVLEYDNPFQGFVPGTGPRLTPPGTASGSAGDTIADRVFGTCQHFDFNNCASSDYADELFGPQSVAFDPKNNALYISNNDPASVFEYNSPLTSQTANLAIGTCGGGFASNECSGTSDASLSEPTGLAVDAQGNLYVADGGGTSRLLMYLDPLGSAGGCPPNSDGSGCPGDGIADKAFGTCGTGADGTGDFAANDCGGFPPTDQSLVYGAYGWNGLAVDANENLYAMDPVNSRALVFPNANSLSGTLTATAIFGQGGNFAGYNPDYGGQPRLGIVFQSDLSSRRHRGRQLVQRLYRRRRQQPRARI